MNWSQLQPNLGVSRLHLLRGSAGFTGGRAFFATLARLSLPERFHGAIFIENYAE